MKKAVWLLILCVLFCGCKKKETPPDHRVVTGVQVEYHQGEKVLLRNYQKTENVQFVLNYLRILKPFGPVIPEGEQTDNCRITLQYSYGPDSIYLQQGNSYLCRNGGVWESIDRTRASLLYPMLLLLPSDA